jgi:CubicO group peptidase (beta-lactamase class C family)
MKSALLCLALVLSTQGAPAAQSPGEIVPDTVPGRRLRAYVDSFNSGDDETVRRFLVENIAKSALAERPVEPRLARYREIFGALRGIRLVRVLASDATSIAALARTASGETVRLRLEVEPDPPNGITGVMIEKHDGDEGEAPGGAVSTTVPAPDADRARVARRAEEYLSRLASFGFSGSVLLASGDQVVFEKAYGMADRAKGVPNTTATVFDTGSIAKQFTAAAILKLEMLGKLNTSDPIGKYLPGVPADKQSITIHNLLTHTSGVIASPGFLANETFEDRDARVKQILVAPLRFKPGESFEYSNAGYNLAAAIVEIASGQPYQQFLYEQLFKPAGMTSSGFNPPGFAVPGWDSLTVARLYAGSEDNGVPYGNARTKWFLLGPGGILTTPGDLFRWHRALAGDAVLSAEARRKFYTPFRNDYAYGWGIRKGPYGSEIEHDGGTTMGAGALLRRFVDAGVTVAFAMNRDGETFVPIVGRDLTRIAFGREVAMPPAVLEALPPGAAGVEGRYASGAGGALSVAVVGNRVELRAEDPTAFAAIYGTEAASENARLVDRTSAIVGASAKGDFEPLAGALIGPAQAQRSKTLWQEWRSRLGEFKGHTVLGVTLESMGDPAVNVRLDFERGPVFTQYVWFPRGLDGVRVLEAAPGRSFRPVSDSEYVSFDLTTGETSRLAFAEGARSLTLTAPGRPPVVGKR